MPSATVAQPYLCTGGIDNGSYRCRNMTPCHSHPAGGDWDPAPPADVVLVKFYFGQDQRLSLPWSAVVDEIGMDKKHLQYLEGKHVDQATRHRRAAYKFRSGKADSGAPVFGRKGLMQCSVFGLREELEEGGMPLFSVELQDRGNYVLQFEYRSDRTRKEPIPFPEALYKELVEGAAFEAHVWTNPPTTQGEDAGNIVETVNLKGRYEGRSHRLLSHGEDAYWHPVPASEEARAAVAAANRR